MYLTKKKTKKHISSILSNEAALLFHLGTDMTGVCAVLWQGMEQHNDDMLIGDRSCLGDYFIILTEML